jgi:hypothetical protein
LGVPNDPAFQNRVLLSALKLLEAERGPVLAEFPEEAPVSKTDSGPQACPVNFASPLEEINTTQRLLTVFEQEMAQLRNWYDLALEKQGRTTSGATGLTPEEVAAFITAFVRGKRQNDQIPELSLVTALRMAAQDLNAYYFEAVCAQPGQPGDSATLADWFWSQTAAAKVINMVRMICLDSEDNELEQLGKRRLIPVNQLHRFKD